MTRIGILLQDSYRTSDYSNLLRPHIGNCGRKMSEGHERFMPCPNNEWRTGFETQEQFIAELKSGGKLFGG